MRSSNRQYLASVDHLRAFAAVLIVFYHGSQLFNAEFQPAGFTWLYSRDPVATVIFEGHTAVALFMVLSGFIFTVGTLGHGVSFPRFMGNRLLRIYPLVALLLLMGLATHESGYTPSGFLQLATGMTSLPGTMDLGPASAMFWAVGVELQFYVMFPLLNRILNRSGVGTMFRLLAAVIVVRAVVWEISTNHNATAILYFNFAGRIDQFLIGMIAAWFFVRHRAWFAGWWKVAIAAGLAVFMLWEFNQVHGFNSDGLWRLGWTDVEPSVWALVILTYVATVRRTANLISRAVAKVGELSYSIYLMHILLITLIIQRQWFVRLPGLPPWDNALLTILVVLLPMVLAVATVTYYGVEQPFLRLRSRYLLPLDAAGSADPVARVQPPPPVAGAGPSRVPLDSSGPPPYPVNDRVSVGSSLTQLDPPAPRDIPT